MGRSCRRTTLEVAWRTRYPPPAGDDWDGAVTTTAAHRRSLVPPGQRTPAPVWPVGLIAQHRSLGLVAAGTSVQVDLLAQLDAYGRVISTLVTVGRTAMVGHLYLGVTHDPARTLVEPARLSSDYVKGGVGVDWLAPSLPAWVEVPAGHYVLLGADRAGVQVIDASHRRFTLAAPPAGNVEYTLEYWVGEF